MAKRFFDSTRSHGAGNNDTFQKKGARRDLTWREDGALPSNRNVVASPDFGDESEKHFATPPEGKFDGEKSVPTKFIYYYKTHAPPDYHPAFGVSYKPVGSKIGIAPADGRDAIPGLRSLPLPATDGDRGRPSPSSASPYQQQQQQQQQPHQVCSSLCIEDTHHGSCSFILSPRYFQLLTAT